MVLDSIILDRQAIPTLCHLHIDNKINFPSLSFCNTKVHVVTTVKHFLFLRTLFSRKFARPVTRENKFHTNISHVSIIVQEIIIAKIKSRE